MHTKHECHQVPVLVPVLVPVPVTSAHWHYGRLESATSAAHLRCLGRLWSHTCVQMRRMQMRTLAVTVAVSEGVTSSQR